MSLARDGAALERPSWTLTQNHPIWEVVGRCREKEREKRPNLSEVLGDLICFSKEPLEVWPSPPESEGASSGVLSSSRAQASLVVSCAPPSPLLPAPP